MSQGRTDAPDFDGSRYERPHKDWLCGHSCDGCPCRIGPSPSGECRATTECKPILVTQPGETKGTWKCTRPKDWGGACPDGPRPDGTCCKEIPKCRPVRTLRSRRGLVTRAVIIASIAGLLIGLSGTLRESFINPAPLSTPHSSGEFIRLAAQHANLPPEAAGQGCVACHANINDSFTKLGSDAIQSAKNSISFEKLATTPPKDFSRMDASCMVCHVSHNFHQANVASPASCANCHIEHQGTGAMAAVSSQNCTACHNDNEQMRLAAAQARVIPAAMFTKPASPGLVIHPVERPAEGYTRTITSFSKDHPEFQVLREQQTDKNTLKFNHRMHLSGETMPTIGGKSLDCASCHQPDASGAFMQRVNFEANCRVCHSLNIDETTPGLELPHGDAAFTRAFLRSLPTQYADYARRKLGLTNAAEIDTFVREKITGLQERTLSGENLERSVFLANDTSGDATVIAGVYGAARARFAGCAYCHEVTPQGAATPVITIPQTPDRWMQHSSFNHAKHTSMACTDCHAAYTSTRTADIIMPTQASCVTCHAPQSRASDSCTTCHTYHNTPPISQPEILKTILKK